MTRHKGPLLQMGSGGDALDQFLNIASQRADQEKENVYPAVQSQPTTAKGLAVLSNTSAALNAPVTPPVTASKPTASRKRKSDAVNDNDVKNLMFPPDMEEIDDEDPRLANIQPETCNAVRRKIRNWIESGAMKVGEFQKELDVSSKAYGSFMNRTKTWDGDGTDTYWKAMLFFKKRELLGLPLQVPKAKKSMTAATATAKGSAGGAGKPQDQLLDTGGVELPGEDTRSVSVFDLPSDVRAKMNALLRKGVPQTALARKLSEMLPEGSAVSPTVLRTFLGQRQKMDGSDSAAFYAGYVFFEKQRIKDGKAKTKTREGIEKAHGPKGVPTDIGKNTHFFCLKGERPHYDKWGVLHFD